MVYNSYSTKEVKHLVEYLARNNPDGKARFGNKLYKELVENEVEWPWSKNHSWQSWRDHYVKNQVELNKKIRRYQEEHGITIKSSKESKDGEVQLKREEEEESNSLDEGQLNDNGKRTREGGKTNVRKRQRAISEERSSSLPMDEKDSMLTADIIETRGRDSLTKQPKVLEYDSPTGSVRSAVKVETPSLDTEGTKEVQEVDQMLVEGTESPRSAEYVALRPSSHPALRDQINKRLGTQVTTSRARPLSSIARKLPLASQSDDSFDSLFDLDSEILAPDSEDDLKPRNRQRQEDDFFRSSPGGPLTSMSPGHHTSARRIKPQRRQHPPTLKEGPFKTTFAGAPKASETVDDSDSDAAKSSTWPPVRKKAHASSSHRKQSVIHKVESRHGTQASKGRIARDGIQYENDPESRATTSRDAPDSTQQQNGSLPLHGRSPIAKNANRHDRLFRITQNTNEIVPRTPPKQKIPDSDSGSALKSSRSACARRSDASNFAQDLHGIADVSVEGHVKGGRHLDLLKQKMEKLSRTSTGAVGSSRSASVASFSRNIRESPLSLELSTQDQSLVTSLGVQQAITMMSKNHGFTEDVVSNILRAVNSIPRADEVLRHMRLKAEEEAEHYLIRRREPSDAGRKLEIYAKLDDEMSDYSPPPKTRAGQFTRLVGQGRYEEAYVREARRASGGASPVKHPSNSQSPSRTPIRSDLKTSDNASPADLFGEKETGTVDDIADLLDAHSAMSSALKKAEGKLGSRRAFDRFQQTAAILRQVLVDHQPHS